MLHLETIDGDTLDLLKRIQGNPVFAETRLVGGTALALQIGHRKSVDLDFFGHIGMAPIELNHELRDLGPVTIRNAGRLVHAFVIRDIRVDFVEYDYPWLDQPVLYDGVRLASCRDIAAMKLAAITNRGTKKDFVDAAFLLKQFTLLDMLAFYTRKYPDGSVFPVLKSLVFFDDAEDDPMPNMIEACTWSSVRQCVAHAVVDAASTGCSSKTPDEMN